MLRRRKDEVLDLPGKLRSWLSVDIPSKGKTDAKRFLKAVVAAKKERAADRASVESSVALMGKLSPHRKKLAIAKTKNTIEFLEGLLAQGEKAVVYTCYTPPSRMLTEHFGEAARMLTGKTPTNQRQGVVDDFQNDDSVRLLVCNIIAGGVGINLTAARPVSYTHLTLPTKA